MSWAGRPAGVKIGGELGEELVVLNLIGRVSATPLSSLPLRETQGKIFFSAYSAPKTHC
jgi:hypothetical protein